MVGRKLNTVFLNFLRGFAPAIFGFLIAIVGVDRCGGDNWGQLVSVFLVLFVFNFIASWGNKEFLIRAYSNAPKRISSLFTSSFSSRLVFLILPFFLLFYYSLETAFLCIALIFLRYVYSSFDSLVIYHQKFASHFFAELVGFLVVIIGIYIAPVFSVDFFLLAYLIGILMKVAIIGFVLKPFPRNTVFKVDKSMLIKTAPFMLIALGGWLHSKIDFYLVDYFLPSAVLSHYQILIVAYLMLDAVPAFIVQPFSKHIYRLNDVALSKMRKILYWLSIPIVLIGSGSIFLFLEIFTTIHFDYWVYLFMTLGAIPPFFYMIDIFILYRRKQEKTILKISFIGAGINLGIGMILIPYYDVLGAVIGVCIAKWVMIVIPFLVKKGVDKI